MAVDLAKLPLVLCGPMLRRVEPNLVSVFVALKHRRKVTLTLVEQPSTPGAKAKAVAGTGVEQETVLVGKYLHLCVVTFRPREALRAGTLYGYDLRFTRTGGADPLDTGPASETLAELGLLGGELPLGYEDGRLPGFAGPPASLGDLRIVHGSCRKPHGKGRDMLPTLDDIIAATHHDPRARPHQLFLTGDQIYADDVYAPLLLALNETGRALLGWNEGVEEVMPVIGKKPGDLTVGMRAGWLSTAGFSSGAMDDHLMGLAEYLAMYLFTWSREVWPTTLSTFAERFPEEHARLEAGGRVTSVDDFPSDDEMGRAVLTFREARYDRAKREYENLAPEMAEFRDDVARVRRALANVPTYMIFDDHEITDDWFVDRKAVRETLGSELGTRVILNGLLAYALFQGWGNDPAGEFAGNRGGAQLLSTARSLFEMLVGSSGGDGERYDSSTTGYRTLLRLLRLEPGSDREGGFSWDYLVRWPTHHTLVLDTRTRRAYVGNDEKAHADLISPASMDRLFGSDGRGGLLARSDATSPVLTVVVSATPVLGHPLHEGASSVLGELGASRYGDREAWLVKGRPRAFEELLSRLSASGRVLVLSGDVHYGFTIAVQYWNERAAETHGAGMVQLCASGCRNQGAKTKIIAGRPAPEPTAFLGWPTPGQHLAGPGRAISVFGTPAVQALPSGNMEVTPPRWRYTVAFSDDSRSAAARGTIPERLRAGPATGNPLLRRSARALTHRRLLENDQMRWVVGFNNLGDVTFTENLPHLIVWHYLWHRVKGSEDAFPYTTHSASAAIPHEAAPRPTPTLSPSPLPPAWWWADLFSFRPSPAVQAVVRAKGSPQWYFHRIENAYAHGPVNVDYYPILVRRLPLRSDGSSRYTAPELLTFMRYLLVTEAADAIIDTDIARFRPYHPDDAADEKINRDRWDSPDPTGAVITIWMNIPGSPIDESGSVICSDHAADHWTFSTLHTPEDGGHPVSGNRMFGFEVNGDGTYTFFTRGVDRLTSGLEGLAEGYGSQLGIHPVFGSADLLWRSFQARVAAFVNGPGLDGQAEVLATETVSVRLDWLQYHGRSFSPSGRWEDGAGR